MGRIVIAGGGIGGLTLAAALQAAGRDVVLLERQDEIRDGGAGISLWPNAVAALDSIHLGELVLSIGRELASGGVTRPNGTPTLTFSARAFRGALGRGIVCVHRGDLVAVLASRLTPGTIRTGATVTGYERSPSGVTVLTDEDRIHADALVGADGIGSAVAAQLAGPLKFTYSGYTAWRGIARFETDPDSDELWACFAQGHEHGWMPLTEGRVYWFVTAWLPEDCQLPGGDMAFLTKTFGHWPEPLPALLAATPPGDWVRNDIVDRTVLGGWTDGPVTLVGDAAHPMRPHLGQGGCQAIEDAAALTEALNSNTDIAGAFRQYERRRRRRTRSIVRRSRWSSFTTPPGWRTALLDTSLSLLPAMSIPRLVIRAGAPIASYKAGTRASNA